MKLCDATTCQNSGHCRNISIDDIDEVLCDCPTGFSGIYCEKGLKKIQI